MQSIGNEFLLLDHYILIKQRIANFLNTYGDYDDDKSPFNVLTMISQLLQISSPELVEELFYHYNDILRNKISWSNRLHKISLYLEIPPVLSIEECNILRNNIPTESDNDHSIIYPSTIRWYLIS